MFHPFPFEGTRYPRPRRSASSAGSGVICFRDGCFCVIRHVLTRQPNVREFSANAYPARTNREHVLKLHALKVDLLRDLTDGLRMRFHVSERW